MKKNLNLSDFFHTQKGLEMTDRKVSCVTLLKRWKTEEKVQHKQRILALFDVDGTLTPARLVISEEMKDLLRRLRCEGGRGGVRGWL